MSRDNGRGFARIYTALDGPWLCLIVTTETPWARWHATTSHPQSVFDSSFVSL